MTQTTNQSRRHWIQSFFEFDLHKDDISREQLKELLYEEITSFKPAIGM